MRLEKLILVALVLAALALPALGEVNVLVGGSPLRQYDHRGMTYIEASRGRDFTIRLTNPTPYRVAVALSVDGLNTIDAKHTTAWNASKWVLDPYETADIEGWQVSDRAARRFYFTGERSSYGAALGRTENLGIIQAVFFRERRYYPDEYSQRQERWGNEAPATPAPAPPAQKPSAGALAQPKEGELSDEYAATGMGGRTRHEVERVSIDLDPHPISTISIRYEFRPQLIKLGVLPAHPTPLERRERARGFSDYCPEPKY